MYRSVRALEGASAPTLSTTHSTSSSPSAASASSSEPPHAAHSDADDVAEAIAAAVAADPSGRFGFVAGIGGLPVAVSAGAAARSDLALTKPVRLGADVTYRVADAEAALEAALNPFAEQTAAAVGEYVAAVFAATPPEPAIEDPATPEGDAALDAEGNPLSEEQLAAIVAAARAAIVAERAAARERRANELRAAFDLPIEMIFTPAHANA